MCAAKVECWGRLGLVWLWFESSLVDLQNVDHLRVVKEVAKVALDKVWKWYW